MSNTPIFTPEELTQLRDDISVQLAHSGVPAAEGMIPKSGIRRKLREIAHGNVAQTNAGLLGGVGGAAVGGGLGALATGLMRGKQHAFKGLIGAIPGSVAGYGVGKEWMQKRQLLDMLKEELGESPMLRKEGAGLGITTPPKRPTVYPKNLDPHFKALLESLEDEKAGWGSASKPRLKPRDVPPAIRDLEQYRGKPLTNQERKTIREVLGPEYAEHLKKKTPPPFRGGGGMGRSSPPKPNRGFREIVKKNPKTFAILGGLAALSALGLLGSKYLTRSRSEELRGR